MNSADGSSLVERCIPTSSQISSESALPDQVETLSYVSVRFTLRMARVSCPGKIIVNHTEYSSSVSAMLMNCSLK